MSPRKFLLGLAAIVLPVAMVGAADLRINDTLFQGVDIVDKYVDAVNGNIVITFEGTESVVANCDAGTPCITGGDDRTLTISFAEDSAPGIVEAFKTLGQYDVVSFEGADGDSVRLLYDPGQILDLRAASYQMNDGTGGIFNAWSSGCDSVSAAGDCHITMNVSKSVTVAFTQANLLTVNKSGSGSGRVTGGGGSIDCGGDCSAMFGTGTIVSLNANATDGSSIFTGWSGAAGCTGTGACTVAMDTPKTVTASFVPNSHTVTPSAGAGGSISPTGVQSVSHGATQSFSVTANTGYTATVGGSCGGSPSSGTGTFNYTTNGVTADCTVAANFALASYTVAPSKTGATGSGNITPSEAQSVSHGTTKPFTITADTGYTATVGGTCGGSPSSGSGTFTYTTNAVTANCTVVANIVQGTTYALAVTKSGTGSGTVTSNPSGINCGPTCSASYASGTSVTLTAQSSDTFAGWSGGCSGTGTTCTVSMSQARGVTATFNTAPTGGSSDPGLGIKWATSFGGKPVYVADRSAYGPETFWSGCVTKSWPALGNNHNKSLNPMSSTTLSNTCQGQGSIPANAIMSQRLPFATGSQGFSAQIARGEAGESKMQEYDISVSRVPGDLNPPADSSAYPNGSCIKKGVYDGTIYLIEKSAWDNLSSRVKGSYCPIEVNTVYYFNFAPTAGTSGASNCGGSQICRARAIFYVPSASYFQDTRIKDENY